MAAPMADVGHATSVGVCKLLSDVHSPLCHPDGPPVHFIQERGKVLVGCGGARGLRSHQGHLHLQAYSQAS